MKIFTCSFDIIYWGPYEGSGGTKSNLKASKLSGLKNIKMCGIAGIVNFSGQPVNISDLEKMKSALAHRGPDGDGIYYHRNIGMVHRRLAIIDLDTGGQPFFNDDRSIVLSYNGEVYNYREIRQELASNYNFRTESDTEVVLKAYEKWGIDCLRHFQGMFSFALYDSNKKLLYLVRDRVGIKPLYYNYTAYRLLFSSELVPLLKLNCVQRDINLQGLAGYFRYQYVPTPASIYKNVFKLEPGYFLEVDVKRGDIKKQQYWNLKINIKERSEGDWLEELNAVLDETIRIYIRSDVPFGCFLSGGVDSSLVTALMTRYLNEPVRTISIGFNERKHSELPFASEVSHILKTDHFEKVVSPELALDVLQKLVVHFGEPFSDSSAIPTYYVSREAANQVKMVLSGDGGDELFGGYLSYRDTFRDYINPPYKLFVDTCRLFGKYAIVPKIRRWARYQGMDIQEKHKYQREIFDDQSLQQLLSPQIPICPSVSASMDTIGSIDPVTFFQAQDFKTYLVDDVLTKVDRMSMANSLEVRVPLLDHKIVELAFSLPLSLKFRLSISSKKIETKYLLRKSASRFFPESFLQRPKMGFGIPIIEWCKAPLKSLIEEGLRDPKNPVFNWIQFRYVQKMLDMFFRGNDLLVAKIWCIFMFDLWMKNIHLGFKL